MASPQISEYVAAILSTEDNFVLAMHRLAILKQLDTKDINLLKQVADLNYSTAVKAVGDCYRKGESVAKNLNEALVCDYRAPSWHRMGLNIY